MRLCRSRRCSASRARLDHRPVVAAVTGPVRRPRDGARPPVWFARGAIDAAALDLYRRRPDVLSAEPNGVYRAALAPDDPGVGVQWQYDNTGQNGGTPDADVDAFEAWDVTRGSASVVIAVLDTGIDQDHPDLSAKIAGNVNLTTSPTVDD